MKMCKVSAVVPARLAESWIADGLRGTAAALLLPLDLLLAVRSAAAVPWRMAALQWAAWLLAWRLCGQAAVMRSDCSLLVIVALAVGAFAAVRSGGQHRMLAGLQRGILWDNSAATPPHGHTCSAYKRAGGNWRMRPRLLPAHGCMRIKEEF